MYQIAAASSPLVKPHSPPRMTLSNGKGVCLPEAPALTNMIKAERIIGACNIREYIIWNVVSEHLNN